VGDVIRVSVLDFRAFRCELIDRAEASCSR